MKILFTWKSKGEELFSAAVGLFVTTFKSISLSVAFKNRRLSPLVPLNLFYSSSFLPQNYNLDTSACRGEAIWLIVCFTFTDLVKRWRWYRIDYYVIWSKMGFRLKLGWPFRTESQRDWGNTEGKYCLEAIYRPVIADKCWLMGKESPALNVCLKRQMYGIDTSDETELRNRL